MAGVGKDGVDRRGVDRSGFRGLRLRMDGGEAKLTQRNLRFDRRMDSFG